MCHLSTPITTTWIRYEYTYEPVTGRTNDITNEGSTSTFGMTCTQAYIYIYIYTRIYRFDLKSTSHCAVCYAEIVVYCQMCIPTDAGYNIQRVTISTQVTFWSVVVSQD